MPNFHSLMKSMQHDPSFLARRVHSYKLRRENCSWTGLYENGSKLSGHLLKWICALEDSIFIRLGPFNSTGGPYNFWEELSYPLSEDGQWVNAIYAHIVDTRGEDFVDAHGISLIHYHHGNLFHTQKFQRSYFNFGSHMTCDSKHGGDACLFVQFPARTGIRIQAPTHIQFGIVDRRQMGTTPVELFMEVGFHLLRSTPQHELLLYPLTIPQLYARSWMATSPNLAAGYGAWLWPAKYLGIRAQKKLSLTWASSMFGFDGEVVWATVHSHQLANKGVIAFGDRPEAAGLNSRRWNLTNAWSFLELDADSATWWKSLPEFRLKPFCRSTSVPFEPFSGSTSMPNYIDRSSLLKCTSWNFRVGDFRTVVCLGQVPDWWPEDSMLFHCVLHTYVTIPETESGQSFFWQSGRPDPADWVATEFPAGLEPAQIVHDETLSNEELLLI